MSGADADFWLPWDEWSEDAKAQLEERLGPEPGWRALRRERSRIRRGRTFVPNELVDDRLCLRMYLRESDSVVVAKAWFGPGAEGPPGHAHGGSQSAVVDHVLGAAVWGRGHRAFTGKLEYSYRQLLPLGTVAWCEAWIEEIRGRKIVVKGRLFEGDTLYGESEALFIGMRDEHLETLGRQTAAASSSSAP